MSTSSPFPFFSHGFLLHHTAQTKQKRDYKCTCSQAEVWPYMTVFLPCAQHIAALRASVHNGQ